MRSKQIAYSLTDDKNKIALNSIILTKENEIKKKKKISEDSSINHKLLFHKHLNCVHIMPKKI